MSEITNTTNETTPSRRNKVVIIILFLLLVSVYIVGYLFLPSNIRSAYQTGNCQSVLSSNDLYARVFPFTQLGQSAFTQVRECAVYTLGVTNEAEKAWGAAYDAFSVYLESYPDGILASDAHDHNAVALMGLAVDDIEQEDYIKANATLNFILENYSDTSQAADAEKMISDIRMKLGQELRNTGDFAAAEQIFRELGGGREIRLELAQTYLAWGLALQAQKKFAEANFKFSLAQSTDPELHSVSGSAMQAKMYQTDLYRQWGDSLVDDGNFPGAIGLYKMAASLGEDQDEVDEMIAKRYIQWAATLDPGEDLFGVLALLDFAQDSSVVDSEETLVKDARTEVYLAFSRSTGEMAQRTIADAVQSVCEFHTEPSLPVFGLGDENIGFWVDGVDVELPDDLVAMTPASLHYVACVVEEAKLVQSFEFRVPIVYTANHPAATHRAYQQVTYRSFQYIWTVILRDITTGQNIGTTSFDGEKLEGISKETMGVSIYDRDFFGHRPTMLDLTDWLLQVTD